VDEERLPVRRVARRLRGVGEIEERQGGTVREAVEGVVEDVRFAFERLQFDPKGDQGQAEHVFVEPPRELLV
jgi:hypothetical protein